MRRRPKLARTSAGRRSSPSAPANRIRPRLPRAHVRSTVAYSDAILRFNGEAMPEIDIAPQTNIKELVAQLPIAAEVLTAFGLGCSGCGVSKYENVEQGARAHGLRVEPIVAALQEARRSGTVPKIAEEARRPAARAPGAFSGRTKFAHTIPIMSGKGGVGKSLVTALLAVGLRRKNYRVGIIDADITGPSIPRLFGLNRPMLIEADPV